MRLAAVAGWLCAAVLLVNTAESAELLPDAPATQLVAPLGQIFAIGFVLGLYLAVRTVGGRLLRAGLVANVAAIAGLTGAAFVLNLVFPYLDRPRIDDLLAGPLGPALVVVSLFLVVATLTFVAGLWRAGAAPRAALVLYAVAALPIGLRAFVPELALQSGLVLIAAAIVWLSLWLWQRAAGARADGAHG
ncbi:hypothetical protein IHE71_25075 [Myceligenerans sp. TRM 65318]|uniref:DUF4386 family protein n=1 Tax=Myceligenerans pegani TaxID=2776917 RepID=A0ABR9N5N2_9MICO|nr:hypothetical protein [Myceligenerans sp. TRM 65318]MBE3021241.1 hypothetical protein [Myceligenerans sp. TRM 65318]